MNAEHVSNWPYARTCAHCRRKIRSWRLHVDLGRGRYLHLTCGSNPEVLADWRSAWSLEDDLAQLELRVRLLTAMWKRFASRRLIVFSPR